MTLVALLLSAVAAFAALVALVRVEQYKLTAPQVRELVREINDALEKLSNQQQRESMRRLRAQRREQPDESEQLAQASAVPTQYAGSSKAQLWERWNRQRSSGVVPIRREAGE